MEEKIITEEDFWVCTDGAIPTQFQGTRELLHDNGSETINYISNKDMATVGWLDFGCKKLMLIYAIIAALAVVVAVAVGIATVATGGAALIAVCAIAGLIGGAVGAIVGGLTCGQLMAKARTWYNYKIDMTIQDGYAITERSFMECKAGGIIRYAPNIRNWMDAISYAQLSYTNELIKCAGAGAMIGLGGAMLGVGASAVPGTGGLMGTGVHFAGRAVTLLKPTLASIGNNALMSFGPIGGTMRLFSGMENAQYTYATGGINKEGKESSVGNEFVNSAVPEYEFANRIKNEGLSGLRPTDALFLLYLLNIKFDPKGTFRDVKGNLKYKGSCRVVPKKFDPRFKPKPANGRPFQNSRPPYRKGLVEEVWEANKKNGKVIDPGDGKVEINWKSGQPRDGVWHMSHKPGFEYRHLQKALVEGRITKQQFMEYYNNPKYYRPETPKTNLSHTLESDISKYPFDK